MSAYTAPTALPAAWLVAKRELSTKLRSRSFLISTGILMLIVLASVVIGGIVGANSSQLKVAAVSETLAAVQHLDGVTVTQADTIEQAEQLVRDKTVDAAVIPDSSPAGLAVVGLDSPPTSLVAMLSVAPAVHLLEPAQGGPLTYFVALGFGLVFFLSALTFGLTIAQSVVEEKQTRIVEILISTLPVRVLLAGKILGNTILAFGQIIVIGLLASIGLLATGQRVLFADLGPSIAWFAVFFVFGFIMLAALFSAAAALVSRQEDLGSVTQPVNLLVMAPYFLVIFFNDNPVVLAIMSYVPFSAPVGMPMRIFLGSAQWWEPLLSLAILIASTAGVIAFASRIYSNGLLRMGSRVKWRDALHK
ncbi:ABC transporter permease [soil metagenome]